MARRRRKKSSIGKYAILIGAIGFLNLMGVSYGYWNDGLQVITSITTGNFDSRFTNANIIMDSQESDIYLYPEISDQGDTLTIKGKVPAEYTNQKIMLNYHIENTGSIPVKVGEKIIEPLRTEDFSQDIWLEELLSDSDQYSVRSFFQNSLDLVVKQFNED